MQDDWSCFERRGFFYRTPCLACPLKPGRLSDDKKPAKSRAVHTAIKSAQRKGIQKQILKNQAKNIEKAWKIAVSGHYPGKIPVEKSLPDKMEEHCMKQIFIYKFKAMLLFQSLWKKFGTIIKVFCSQIFPFMDTRFIINTFENVNKLLLKHFDETVNMGS